MKDMILPEVIFEKGNAAVSGEALFYREKGEWKSLTWKDLMERVENLARGLLSMGIHEGERIGIFSASSPEWIITEAALQCLRAVPVPIYEGLTPVQTEYLVKDACIRILFVGGQEEYDTAVRVIGGDNTLSLIIVMKDLVKVTGMERGQGTNIRDFNSGRERQSVESVFRLKDIMEKGRLSDKGDEFIRRMDSINNDDLAGIYYTSGTSGYPKGVLISHGNILSVVKELMKRFDITERDTELSFLPLSNLYARSAGYWMLYRGARVYFCDDTENIMDYFQEVKPTFIVGVPWLYEKIYSDIKKKVESMSSLKRSLFRWSLQRGIGYHKKKYRGASPSFMDSLSNMLAGKLVLNRVKRLFGGNIRFCSTGGVPTTREIEEFFFSAGIFIAQGYGLTETSPLVSCNCPEMFRFGSVGRIIDCCEVKIENDGEILVRGENVTRGYHNKPDHEREFFLPDGWFRTGDIGTIDSDGFLYVTERKKDIIITGGGKNISPQNIESILTMDYYIEQAVVVGDRRRYITALIVPSYDALEQYARSRNISWETTEELTGKPEIIELIRERLEGKNEMLAPYERVRDFRILPRPLTVQKGELTPTGKTMRKTIHETFREYISDLYRE